MVVPFIDLVKYRERYADLDAAFGDDMDAYLEHYLVFGVYEGREAFGTSFDARAYADRYPDLKEAFGYDVLALYKHWLDYGMKEGRNPLADVPVYNAPSTGSVPSAPEVVIPETVATTVVFLDENGNPIPNAVVRLERIADIGLNNHSASSVSGGDSGSVPGGDSGSMSGVSQEGDLFVVTTDEEGRYTVPDLPSGVYTVDAEAPGYLPLHMNQVVIGVTGTTMSIPTFEMLSADMSGTNTVEGYAKDASTGGELADVTVRVRADWNNYDGDVLNEINTDETGHYSFTLTRGYYTIELARQGYTSAYVNIATSNRFDAARCTGVLSAIINEVTSGQYRIVLTWGEEPQDLDSHLVGPSANASASGNDYFHVYFANNYYMENGVVKASLDVDDTTSYGPETVTILYVDSNETYYYSIHDYTNGWQQDETDPLAEQTQYTALANSGANVKVYDGSSLVKEYNVPATEAGTVWNVFKIENGVIISINEVNADYSTMFGEYRN